MLYYIILYYILLYYIIYIIFSNTYFWIIASDMPFPSMSPLKKLDTKPARRIPWRRLPCHPHASPPHLTDCLKVNPKRLATAVGSSSLVLL